MIHPRTTLRILLTLALGSFSAIGAYGRSASSLRSLTRQTGEGMSFLAWMVFGLIAGYIGSKMVLLVLYHALKTEERLVVNLPLDCFAAWFEERESVLWF